MVGLTGWYVLPLVPLLLWFAADRWPGGAALPQEWSWAGVRTAVAAGGLAALGRSAVLGLAVAAVATPLGALAGFGLARRRVWLPRTTALLLLAPLAVPPFALALGLDPIILRLHLPSTLGLAIVLSVLALPYTAYVMWLAGSAHDPRFAEEARTLGATPGQAFVAVQLPQLAPALAAAAFLAFLVGWSDYVVTLIIGAGQLITVPILTASYAAGVGSQSVVAVLALIAILPPIALYVMIAASRRGIDRP